jgi:hypothetical protein
MTTSLELAQKSETDAGERFRNDTAKHELTILHDDGLYRHLRFRQPAPGMNWYWFDLITWPGCLTIRGDLGDSYTFARLPDMFEFFRGKRINPHYWSEKLDRGRNSAKEYSEALFRQLVIEHFVNVARDSGVPAGLGKAIRAEILDQDLTVESEARELLEAFEYGEAYTGTCGCGERVMFGEKFDADMWQLRHRCSHRPAVRHTPPFRFHDVWEWSFSDYEWQFLWACHAIVWGIRQYDAAKTPVPVPALSAAAEAVAE